MKTICLKKRVVPTRSEPFFLKDLEDSVKSCIPGEWVELKGTNKESTLGFVNPFHEDGLVAWSLPCSMIESEESYIKQVLVKALERRQLLGFDLRESRLFYGQADGLPGLVIDSYLNQCVVQISTMGVARFHKYIKNILENDYQLKVVFLANPKQNKKEQIPEFNHDSLEDIHVRDNSLEFLIPVDYAQKAGYYYDHSLNRKKMADRISLSQLCLKKGVDLFSYCGSWGVHALGSGCSHMTFVDQSPIVKSIKKTLDLNKFSQDRAEFIHKDVFSFLEGMIEKQEKFQLVIADPPAFSKSVHQLKKALSGYQKLIQKMLKVCSSHSFMVLGSCTHGVSLYELDKIVSLQLEKSKRKATLIELGHQRADHPSPSLDSRESYIKFLMYYLD